MRPFTLSLAVLVAFPVIQPALAAAQNASGDAGFTAAVSQAHAALAAAFQDSAAKKAATSQVAAAQTAAKAPSCADAKPLETRFELRLATGRKIAFTYKDCREEGRNDYLPPYTERSYEGSEGYGLTLVTNQGEPQSEVLISHGKDWVGRGGMITNESLASGSYVSIGEIDVNDGAKAAKSRGELRSVVPTLAELFPQLKACDAAADKQLGGRNLSLMLLTETDAYYYHEDCDICAELTACKIQTQEMRSVIVAHSVSCEDLAPYRKGKVLYDSCKGTR